ncbi:MAG: DEAD/DEAH box helicase family protein, partial [Leptolyngbyaceae cyanobacterium SL_7_1]|nr:DEAD/DEAH box helicase family protein [Leptolyngbyaceae cyanobacterium SL_7_1]
MQSSSPVKSVHPPILRPYQVNLIKDLYAKLGEGHQRVAVIAGTGAGKTVIAGQICAHAESRGRRLLFLVHLDVLVGQTYDKMQAFGLHCGFIKAGWREDPTAPIQIASIQTMMKRSWWRQWHADVVLYDEGHTTIFSQVGQTLLYKTHPQAIHLALTATPYRLGKEQLGDHMDTLVASPVPSEIQRMGFLAPMKYYGMPANEQIDLSEVRTVGGDFDERDLKNACDRPELVERIVEEWFRLAPDRRTIAFCVDVEHARHVADAFRSAGIAAGVVDGSTSLKDRQRLYTDLRDGNLVVLTSCNVISIGFDEPSVEVGLLLRPTQSRALHFQQIGRVMRISPATGKTHGIILDQA